MVGVVPLPVLFVHKVALGVALMGVPIQVPWGHAHSKLTHVACLQLWAGWGAPVHIAQQLGDVDLLAGKGHGTHCHSDAMLLQLDA